MADLVNILVTPDILREKAGELRDSARCFEDKLLEIKQIMEGLAGNWEGQAMTDFLSQFKKLDNNRDAYKNAILDYTFKLNDAADAYEATESKLSAETAKLDNSQLFA